MRRSIVLSASWTFVLLCLLGSVCSADKTGKADEAGTLRVATFRSDVTPPLGHPFYPDLGPLATVEHRLWAKGIVLDDGRRRYVLCAVDWCALCNSTHRLFQTKVAKAAGTEEARVAIQCVHQHTALYANGDAQELLNREKSPPKHLDPKFLEAVTDRLAAAVRKSLDRLEVFDHVGVGQAKVERVASTRRVPTKDGKIRIRWSSCTDPALRAEPEGFIDPMLKTITLARGEKALVRLHYYATHPQSFYGDHRASCDFPGLAREALERKEKVPQIYFTGCAGDVTAGKYNDRSRRARDELTARMLAGMEASVAATRLAPVDRLTWRTVPLRLPLRTDAGYTTKENLARMADPKIDGPARLRAADAVAFARRIDRPILLSVLSLGKVRILHLPGEPMVEFQWYAQKAAPKSFVAVAGYGDGGPGYICTERAFGEGGYEPTASRVAPGSEKVLKEAIRRLLDESM